MNTQMNNVMTKHDEMLDFKMLVWMTENNSDLITPGKERSHLSISLFN